MAVRCQKSDMFNDAVAVVVVVAEEMVVAVEEAVAVAVAAEAMGASYNAESARKCAVLCTSDRSLCSGELSRMVVPVGYCDRSI